MGCQGSTHKRNSPVKKQTQYKGMFTEKIMEDIEKRQMVSHCLKQQKDSSWTINMP